MHPIWKKMVELHIFLFFNLLSGDTVLPLHCASIFLFQRAIKGRTQHPSSIEKAKQIRCNNYADVDFFLMYFNDKQRKTEGIATTDLEKKSGTVSICSAYKFSLIVVYQTGHICYNYLYCHLCPRTQKEGIMH